MNIICAGSVDLGREAFEPLGSLQVVPETEITRETLRGADALICRSKNPLNASLLEGSSLRFAGTCTAGIDHADTAWLAANGIHFASAPGCNANAVSEYVLAALLDHCERCGDHLRGRTLAVVGCGNVGSRVAAKAERLGMRVLRNDPPLAERSGASGFVPLRVALEQADIVSLHVPLVEQGPHPTRGLIGEKEWSVMKDGVVFLNACRGEVVENAPLIAYRRSGKIRSLILDVWDPEPAFPLELLELADIATPHIAGHSVEGKVNGTRQVREAFCAWAGIVDVWDPIPLLPPPEQALVSLPAGASFEQRLQTAVSACYQIRLDDQLMRSFTGERGKHFNSLRRGYRDRREFSATTVLGLVPQEAELYAGLGFRVT